MRPGSSRAHTNYPRSPIMNLAQVAKDYRDKYGFSVFPVVLSHKADKEKFDKKTVRVGGNELDVRGEHGFVVIPPSEFDSHSYTWEVNGNLEDRLKELPEF